MKDKTCKVAINPKYDRCQKGLVSMVYKFFDKKTGVRMSVNELLALSY